MKTQHAARACLLALMLTPVQVAADPISVTSGFFSVTGLFGSGVFELQGQGFQASGNLEPGVVWPALTCSPCEPGAIIDLRTTFEGSTGHGTATVDGTTYQPLIGLAASDFIFAAPGIVAPGTEGSFSVTRPFTFSGRLAGFDIFDPHQQELFQRMLTGQGLLTASFIATPNPGGPPLFSFESIRYDFAEAEPVPEPATFLLAATGLGAVLRLRKRARPSSS